MDPQEPEMTVGQVLDLLSACDPDARIELAINPFFPMAHRMGGVISTRDETGSPVVYIAESKDAEQLGHLPPAVAVALTWQEPTDAPPRRRRKATRP